MELLEQVARDWCLFTASTLAQIIRFLDGPIM